MNYNTKFFSEKFLNFSKKYKNSLITQQKLIKKMLSIINDFFEICKIKIEMDFINKIKHYDKYEKMKNLLRKNFSEYLLNIDIDNISNEKLSIDDDIRNNYERQTLNGLHTFLYKKENTEILKYLTGRIYFNKFFEITEIKNRYEFKKTRFVI